ncbi:immunoglobulin-like domain-containing protein [Crassaminicella profunda]|uniref:immunoglobulin-like domain-containing protein n=1 Tax=Crassaminicella profunda TaxID=1286698 RepID=UPI001CA73B2D|nr:immunoglobulin-like domain-containing protein [Crassaminicella profunda]QZY54095.1 hypothetical protein K7H06_13695 [Crassaminicella profunda]
MYKILKKTMTFLLVLVMIGGVPNFYMNEDTTAYAEGMSIIDTVAGTGWSGYSGDGGLATAAKLDEPIGVAVDSYGNIYIVDIDSNCIRKVNTSGIITTVAGTGESGYSGDNGLATEAKLNSPYAVAIDYDGNVYISDRGNNCIRKINTSGIITTIAGTGESGYLGDGGNATEAKFNSPSGIAVDSHSNIYIADSSNHRIRKIDKNGKISTVAGKGSSYGDLGDNGLATEATLNRPYGVAVDNDGNIIYIADSINRRIRKVNTSGIITTVAGTGEVGYSGDGEAATGAKLNFILDLAVDHNGNIYISDNGARRIRKVDTSGIITTVAGNGEYGYSGDGGAATEAKFNGTYGIDVDNDGNIYTADTYNYRIRKVVKANSPTVITDTATDITPTTSKVGGNVIDHGGVEVVDRGVVYATHTNPTIADTKVAVGAGTGTFTTNLTGLTKNTTYYVRAYAKNAVGMSYGAQVSFTTIERKATAVVDEGLIEENLKGKNITLTLSGDVFAPILDEEKFTLNNAPIGLIISNITKEDNTHAKIVLDYDHKDFDSNITNFNITVDANQLAGDTSLTTENMTITANNDIESIIITDDGKITEGREDGEIITVNITGGNFVNSLTKNNWKINNLPEGVSIDSINRVNETQAKITLKGNRTNNFENNINLTVTCTSDEYIESLGNTDLTSNNIILNAMSDEDSIEIDKNVLDIGFGVENDKEHVTKNITLPTNGDNGTNISWKSSDVDYVSENGVVKRPSFTTGDVNITVTATIDKNGVKTTKTFELKILKLSATDQEAVAEAKEELQIIYADGDHKESVTKDMIFSAKGSNKTFISWESSNEDYVSVTGAVYRPSFTKGNVDVTVTANVYKNDEKDVKTFELKILSLPATDEEAVSQAKEGIQIIYADGDNKESVTKDMKFIKKGSNETFISWTSSNTDYVTVTGVVYRPSFTIGDVDVTVIASVYKNDTKDQKTFKIKVLKLPVTDKEMIIQAKEALKENSILGENNNSKNITKNLVLPKNGVNNTNITWSTDSTEYINIKTGEVTRPAYNIGDVTITLVATIKKGNLEEIKEFIVTIKKDEKPKDSGSSSNNKHSSNNNNQEQESEKTYFKKDDIKTIGDQALDKSMISNKKAIIFLENEKEGKVEITLAIIKALEKEKKGWTIENRGIQLDFAPKTLQTNALQKSLENKDEKLILKVGALSKQEIEKIENNKVLKEKGLESIGSGIFDVAAQMKNTKTNKNKEINYFFEPVKVTIDLSNQDLTEDDFKNLTGVRYEKDEKGNVIPVKLGGIYDKNTKTFTYYTDRPDLCSVVKARNLLEIDLMIDKLEGAINHRSKMNDVEPKIINNRTMIPIRFVAENLGADVKWIEKSKTIVINYEGKIFSMVIGKPIEGFDTSATISNNRTLVPLRYVSEKLGATVMWFPGEDGVKIIK